MFSLKLSDMLMFSNSIHNMTCTYLFQPLLSQDNLLKSLYTPPYVLAPPPLKNKKTSDSEGFGSTTERR